MSSGMRVRFSALLAHHGQVAQVLLVIGCQWGMSPQSELRQGDLPNTCILLDLSLLKTLSGRYRGQGARQKGGRAGAARTPLTRRNRTTKSAGGAQ